MNTFYKFAILATTALAVVAAPIESSATRNTTATLIPLSQQGAKVLSTTISDSEFSGRGTWFTDTVGSCETPFDTNDMIVAVNAEQMDGTSQCGRTVKITVDGKSVEATVVDTCPSQYCSYGALDLSQAVFKKFAPLSQGVIQVTWKFVN
ncbi:hypothetical protein BGZ80_006536 [Entomortierella chlamydospora]|uniref:RlpA-like protein double-psi beta-barrel domain-containing protein n=1 Tax=Entomortierella chlamydospora TaxID=101097 RepID=A0A9P6MZ42_9FUNG|nr:hypothetical protein BGZ79_007434 [Entomortierella chlamydospora]KAG0018936.1 hypothetical protein BGZ80_006536 [Entomortierella chlamydospora]